MRELTQNDNAIDRTEFGPDSAGQKAHDLIASGVICEEASGCNEQAVATIDFNLDQIPVCASHYSDVLASIAKDPRVGGTLSTNGFGRS